MSKPDEYLPDFKSEITRDIHEHEVFLAFNSDEHAYAFEEWWLAEGQFLFTDWVSEKIDE